MDEILYRVENGAALLTINRPQARNALNWAAQEEFATAVTTAAFNRRTVPPASAGHSGLRIIGNWSNLQPAHGTAG
jgi:enoyl-CoA hydratase/carnithine racemase